MKEIKVNKNGREVIEVRSDGSKLLYVKTKEGYEMKCPRTKKICIVGYDQMLFDCLQCFAETAGDEQLKTKSDQLRELLSGHLQKV